MTMKWRPTLRLRVREGESALSYLVRLGARNGDADVARFASDVGVSIDGLRTGREVAALELAAQLPEGSLAAWSPIVHAPSRTLVLKGETVRLHDWAGAKRRWCSACFAEDRAKAVASGLAQPDTAPYHRAIWDLMHLSCCPEHGMALKTCCPTCRQEQDWVHAPLDVCACGTKLSSEKFSVEKCDPLSQFLNSRVAGSQITEPTLLVGEQLSKCLPLLERLGLAALADPRCNWASISDHGAQQCASRGFEIASEWPHAFVEVLDRVVLHRAHHARSLGMTLGYGWIHEHWIQPMAATGAGGALKFVLLEHATSNAIIAAGEAMLGRQADRAAVSMTEAARQLGMGHERARGLLMRNGSLPLGRRRSVGMPIHRSEIERLREDCGRRLDARSARSILGVGRKAFVGFVRSGLVASVEEGHGTDKYVGADVCSLSQEICFREQRFDEVPDGCLTLLAASRNFGIPIAELARRVSARELQSLGAVGASPTICDIVVCAADLHCQPRTSDGELTLQGAAKVLRLHPEAVLYLANVDLLTGRRQGRNWAFEEVVVRNFEACHVSASSVAKRLGTSPRSAIAKLASLGIRPVVGPPQCRQAVFRKNADEKANHLLA